MKKIYPLALILLLSLSGTATVHVVNIFCTGIVPASTTATCGDTISFHWSGCQDTVYSGIIPGCATAWHTPMNNTIPSYTVVVPCAGVYNFKNLAVSGTITVTCATGIADNNESDKQVSVYPNPCSGLVKLDLDKPANLVEVYSLTGEKVAQFQFVKELQLYTLPRGIYVLRVYSGKDVFSQRIILN